AFYEFDVPSTPLRFIVLDTSAETGASQGVLHQADLENVVRPMLDRAKSDGRWVVLASHHGVGSIGDGSDFGGVVQPDAVTAGAWQSLLLGYPNILFNIVGHSHVHRIGFIGDRPGFWELTTSALADHPHQMRVLEIWDDDNGFIRLKSDGLDFAT